MAFDGDLRNALWKTREDAQELDVLCAVCQRITDASLILCKLSYEDETFEHQPSLTALTESANYGCHLCSLLDAVLSTRLWYLHLRSEPDLQLQLRISRRVHDSYTQLELLASGKIVSDISSVSVTQAADHDVLGHCPLSRSTAAESTLRLAKRWLEACLNFHSPCHQRSLDVGEDARPTRLVQIWAKPARLRLVNSLQMPPSQYCTLSYCWGQTHSVGVKLTNASLKSFKTSIPYGSLPKSLQDAIVVTVQLGFQYIWIDRLCIIQDDEADWKHEASRMGSYYRKSVLNIAALHSSHSGGGCFTLRNPLKKRACKVTTRTGEQIYLEKYRRITDIDGQAPLMTRAWVLQERLMSPRTLYFGSDGISWECCVDRFCEGDPGRPSSAGLHPTDPSGTFADTEKKELSDLIGLPHLPLRHTLHHFRMGWSRLLARYTSCALTHSADRLVAIAGCINMIARHRGLANSHGLWEDFFLDELLWHNEDQSCTADHLQRKRVFNGAPTWSWGSISGKVKLPYSARNDYVYVNGKPKLLRQREAGNQGLIHTSHDHGTAQHCEIELNVPLSKAIICKEQLPNNLHGLSLRLVDERVVTMGRGFWPDFPIAAGQKVWLVALRKNVSEPHLHALEAAWGSPQTEEEWGGLVVMPELTESGQIVWTRVGAWEVTVPANHWPPGGPVITCDDSSIENQIRQLKSVLVI
jgi:hypothetical protein